MPAARPHQLDRVGVISEPLTLTTGPSDIEITPVSWKTPNGLKRGLLRLARIHAAKLDNIGTQRLERCAAALLAGQSWAIAAASIGLSSRDLRKLRNSDRELGEWLETCEDLGFSNVIESELYSRAMGGPDDRGSIRALELLIKSRRQEYREKVAGEITVAHRVDAAFGAFVPPANVVDVTPPTPNDR